tara:strand:+ start:138 stop:1145 length:1008 start_codon:yes stop_codon:yes gene_type:complete
MLLKSRLTACQLAKLISVTFTFILLTGCASGPPAQQHYQTCNNYLDTLDDVLSCGKKARNDSCLSNNSCSTDGDNLVSFFDELRLKLESGELSGSDARLIFNNQIRYMEILRNQRSQLEFFWPADVNAFSSSEASTKKTYFLLPLKGSSVFSNLESQEYASYLDRALISKGFTKVNRVTDADIAIVAQYSVGSPTESSFTQYYPVEGVTGVSSSTTKASVDAWGKILATTKYNPSYGVIGEKEVTYTSTRHLSQLQLTALDLQTKENDGKLKELWTVSSQMNLRENDMRRLFPALTAAAQPYFGKSTGQVIKSKIYRHSLPIRKVKGIIDPRLDW